MTRWFSLICCALLVIATVGCAGKKEIGPATEDDTPKVSEEDVQDNYNKGMPDDAKAEREKMGYK